MNEPNAVEATAPQEKIENPNTPHWLPGERFRIYDDGILFLPGTFTRDEVANILALVDNA